MFFLWSSEMIHTQQTTKTLDCKCFLPIFKVKPKYKKTSQFFQIKCFPKTFSSKQTEKAFGVR